MPIKQMSQNDLQQEIDQLGLIIETNQAALRLAAMSDADRRQLLQAIEHCRLQLAVQQPVKQRGSGNSGQGVEQLPRNSLMHRLLFTALAQPPGRFVSAFSADVE